MFYGEELLKNKVKFKSLNKNLTHWRVTKNSLSSSTYQKLIDGFRVYNTYLKFSMMKSCLYLFLLSLNYFLKKINNIYLKLKNNLIISSRIDITFNCINFFSYQQFFFFHMRGLLLILIQILRL